MTDQRDEMNDRDTAISRTYRQLADETTPADLDARILAEAARAARPGYVRPIRWMRPLAWAATIVLTVSVLLHMAELPTPADITAPTVEQDAGPGDPGSERLDTAVEPAAAPAQEPASARDAVVLDEAAMTPAPAAERRERPAAAGAAANAATAKAAESFEAATRSLPDNDMLRRASELASDQESGSEATSVAGETAFSLTAADPSSNACAEFERRAGDTWFACIERLRAAGFDAAAASELAELTKAFPDFEMP